MQVEAGCPGCVLFSLFTNGDVSPASHMGFVPSLVWSVKGDGESNCPKGCGEGLGAEYKKHELRAAHGEISVFHPFLCTSSSRAASSVLVPGDWSRDLGSWTVPVPLCCVFPSPQPVGSGGSSPHSSSGLGSRVEYKA